MVSKTWSSIYNYFPSEQCNKNVTNITSLLFPLALLSSVSISIQNRNTFVYFTEGTLIPTTNYFTVLCTLKFKMNKIPVDKPTVFLLNASYLPA